MLVVDAVAEILHREGVRYLSAYPTTPIIESCASRAIRPIVCRQERIGVGIADGYARVLNGAPPGVFAMQFGPGAENAYPGIATAFSDSTPVVLLPLGHPRTRDGIRPHYSAVRGLASVTKLAEQVTVPERIANSLRRAFSAARNGRPGPAVIEIPIDVATMNVDEELVHAYRPVQAAALAGGPR